MEAGTSFTTLACCLFTFRAVSPSPFPPSPPPPPYFLQPVPSHGAFSHRRVASTSTSWAIMHGRRSADSDIFGVSVCSTPERAHAGAPSKTPQLLGATPRLLYSPACRIYVYGHYPSLRRPTSQDEEAPRVFPHSPLALPFGPLNLLHLGHDRLWRLPGVLCLSPALKITSFADQRT